MWAGGWQTVGSVVSAIEVFTVMSSVSVCCKVKIESVQKETVSALKGRLYLYASRSTHGLSENAEDGVLVFFTGGCWQELLYLPLLSRKKRQTFPLAGEKIINQQKYSYWTLFIGSMGLGVLYHWVKHPSDNKQQQNTITLIAWNHRGEALTGKYTSSPLGPLTWHYPPPSCPSGKPSWPGLPKTSPSLEPGWWRAGRVGPTQSLAPRRPHSLHRETTKL